MVHLRKLDGEELPSLTPLQSADCRNGDGEAIALPEVLAESDEEKKADAAPWIDFGGGAQRERTFGCPFGAHASLAFSWARPAWHGGVEAGKSVGLISQR